MDGTSKALESENSHYFTKESRQKEQRKEVKFKVKLHRTQKFYVWSSFKNAIINRFRI